MTTDQICDELKKSIEASQRAIGEGLIWEAVARSILRGLATKDSILSDLEILVANPPTTIQPELFKECVNVVRGKLERDLK